MHLWVCGFSLAPCRLVSGSEWSGIEWRGRQCARGMVSGSGGETVCEREGEWELVERETMCDREGEWQWVERETMCEREGG